jgi:hypothetical protein
MSARFRSNVNPMLRSPFAETIFTQKYAHENCMAWSDLCKTLVEDVCRDKMSKEDKDQLTQYMTDMKFIPGGRYLYYAGRKAKFFNNCYLLKAEEDSREDWAQLSWKSESCLMTGGGIGADYTVYRPSGKVLNRTGGVASGPIPKINMINEIGRHVMQGGSRRSAIYGCLGAHHDDAMDFIKSKDWHNMPIPGIRKEDGTPYTIWDAKQADFNYPAPLDMTNISLNYNTAWLTNYWNTNDPGAVFKPTCDRRSQPASRVSASTFSTRKMRRSATRAPKSRAIPIPTCAILAASISGASRRAGVGRHHVPRHMFLFAARSSPSSALRQGARSPREEPAPRASASWDSRVADPASAEV